MNEVERHVRATADRVAHGVEAAVRMVRGVVGGDPESSDETTDVDEALEFAAETGDRQTLRHFAGLGNTDAQDLLVELAIEEENIAELTTLAEAGSSDAMDALVEFASGDEDVAEELRLLAEGGGTAARDALAQLLEE